MDFGRIVDIQFKQIQQRLHEAGFSLEATDEVLDHLGEPGSARTSAQGRSSACCSA